MIDVVTIMGEFALFSLLVVVALSALWIIVMFIEQLVRHDN